MDKVLPQRKRRNDAGQIESPADADQIDDGPGSYYYDDSTNYEVYRDDDEIEDQSSPTPDEPAQDSTS